MLNAKIEADRLIDLHYPYADAQDNNARLNAIKAARISVRQILLVLRRDEKMRPGRPIVRQYESVALELELQLQNHKS